jgi:hypothetical protein
VNNDAENLRDRIEATAAVAYDLMFDGALVTAHYDKIIAALGLDDAQAEAAWNRMKGAAK